MRCNYCNSEHPDSTLYCPNTGKKIEQILKCNQCGNINIPKGAGYCPKCGNSLNNPDRVLYSHKKKSYSGTPGDFLFDIFAAILCIGGIIVGFINLTTGEILGGLILIGVFSLLGIGRIWARKDYYK